MSANSMNGRTVSCAAIMEATRRKPNGQRARRKGERGMTLGEIMVVVIIIAILAAIAIPVLTGNTRKAKASEVASRKVKAMMLSIKGD